MALLEIDNLSGPHKEVLGFLHTPLLGLIEIGFGVLLILAGVVAGAARGVNAHAGEGADRYFRWSHAPSGIHFARMVVNSSGHTVTSAPFCHCSM